MADVFSIPVRSALMAKIRGHGNATTELRLITLFRQHQISGWRRRQKVFGNPDFVFISKKVAVFVDGCFWHGCAIHYQPPETNRDFWRAKIARNISRDKLVNRQLKRLGWRVIRIWQHELSNDAKVAGRIEKVLAASR